MRIGRRRYGCARRSVVDDHDRDDAGVRPHRPLRSRAGDTDAVQPTDTEPATTDPDESETTASTEPTSGDPTTTTGPGSTDPAQCLVGTWRLADSGYLEGLVRTIDDVGQIESVEPRGGQYVFVFGSDGSFVARREAWSFGLGTIQGTIVTTITSDEPGTFVADGSQLVIDSTPSAPIVTVQLEETSGAVRDVPPGETLTVGADPVTGATAYACSDTTLDVSLPTAQGTAVSATFARTG